MSSKIKKFVQQALKGKNNKKMFLELGTISTKQADFIKNETGIDLTDCKRYIDNFGIKHAIKKHGNPKIEQERGQIAIGQEDFEKLNEIFENPDEIIFLGRNKIALYCFLYQKEINNTYFVVESVRTKGTNKMYFETMYKRKKPPKK